MAGHGVRLPRSGGGRPADASSHRQANGAQAGGPLRALDNTAGKLWAATGGRRARSLAPCYPDSVGASYEQAVRKRRITRVSSDGGSTGDAREERRDCALCSDEAPVIRMSKATSTLDAPSSRRREASFTAA